MSGYQSYTPAQLEHIAIELKRITVRGLPVFDVEVLDGSTHEAVGLDDMGKQVYIRIENWQTVGNLLFDVKHE